jgi:hypothetical protein
VLDEGAEQAAVDRTHDEVRVDGEMCRDHRCPQWPVEIDVGGAT